MRLSLHVVELHSADDDGVAVLHSRLFECGENPFVLQSFLHIAQTVVVVEQHLAGETVNKSSDNLEASVVVDNNLEAVPVVSFIYKRLEFQRSDGRNFFQGARNVFEKRPDALPTHCRNGKKPRKRP